MAIEIKRLQRGDFAGTRYRPEDFPRYDRCDVRLLEILQSVTIRFGVKGVLTSTFRTPAENRQVGGVSRSMHQYGQAVDVVFPGVPYDRLLSFLQTHPAVGGLALQYPTGALHIDTRAQRPPAKWGEVVTMRDGRRVKTFNHSLSDVLAMFPTPIDLNVSRAVDPVAYTTDPVEVKPGVTPTLKNGVYLALGVVGLVVVILLLR